MASETLFRFLVELEVAKAQRLRYCVSVVSLAVDSEVGPGSVSRLTEGFVDRIRSTDIIISNPEFSWTLLLVDAEPHALRSIVHRLTEQFGSLPWRAGAASYPATAVDADDLLCQAAELGARAHTDGHHARHFQNAYLSTERTE